jgi:glycosyltransferase involved in cell wall biosynthesis
MSLKFHFLAPNSTERWDWRSPDWPGIGGSETAVTELSRRLGRRGHDVTVYCKTREDTTNDGPTKWRAIDQCDPSAMGIWIVCRSPNAIDILEPNKYRRIWHRCDDAHYGDPPYWMAMTQARAAKLDVIQCMSPHHRQYFVNRYKFLDPKKVHVFPGGIASDRIKEHFRNGYPERDRNRLIWTSSPDRGIENCLAVFQRCREFVPELELHVYYGWDNIDQAIQRDPQHPLLKFKNRVMSFDQTNVFWEGRVSKQDLWTGIARSNLFTYISSFSETFAVNAAEAQALGAIPVCRPYWALRTTVQHGMFVHGDAEDPLVQAEYLAGILTLYRDTDLCEKIRDEMQGWAMDAFDWERVTDQHEAMAHKSLEMGRKS